MSIIKQDYGETKTFLHKYSTEEQVVGVWIDEKPIYEKTFYYPNGGLAQGTHYFNTDISVDVMITIYGACLQTNGSLNPLPFVDPMNINPNYGIAIAYDKTNNRIVTNANVTGYASAPFFITIQYTKN